MFKALVLVCVIGQPNECALFEDTTGLKDTEQECYARGMEMAKAVIPLFPAPMQAHFRCEKADAI